MQPVCSASAEILCPAMSTLTVETSPIIWNQSALGTPASGSQLGLNFAGAPSTLQVRIQWKPIFIAAVQAMRGTQPVYTFQKTADGLFRSCVRFELPFDIESINTKKFAVVGKKCSTLLEADSEASAAALQELQNGHLRMSVTDVSRMRSKEIEQSCYKILANAGEVYFAVKQTLADWVEAMNKADDWYRTPKNYDHMMGHVVDQLFKIMNASYLQQQKLVVEIEEVKDHIEGVHERVDYFFMEPSSQQGQEHRGILPQEIKLSMQLVLEQMVISLAWAEFAYNISSAKPNVYTCETTIFLDHGRLGAAPRTLTFTGPKASTKEKAIERSCEAAILALEKDKSICLVDLNYSHRSYAEFYVVEAEGAMRFASMVASKVLAEWQSMADKMQMCEEYCQKAATVEPGGEEGSTVQKMQCAYAVSRLRSTCLADLQLSKHRLKNAGAWIQ